MPSVNRDLEKEIEESCQLKVKEVLSTSPAISVFRAINELNDFKTIKVIANKSFFRSEILKMQILHELKIGKMLQYSNSFVRLETHVYTQNYLVLIYEDHLPFCLEQMYQDLDLTQYLSIIFKDLVDALATLRDNKLIHHDISLRNVFLINGYVRLGGLEHIFPISSPLPSFYVPESRPLESLAPEFYTKKNLIYASQIFSLGVLIYWLLFERFPFPSEVKTHKHFSEFYAQRKVINLETNAVCPEPNIFTIVKECLLVEYADRITLRYLKSTLDTYCKNKGSLLNMRKNVMSKNKENMKKNVDLGKIRKDSSFNSYKKCNLISDDETGRRGTVGTQANHEGPVTGAFQVEKRTGRLTHSMSSQTELNKYAIVRKNVA